MENYRFPIAAALHVQLDGEAMLDRGQKRRARCFPAGPSPAHAGRDARSGVRRIQSSEATGMSAPDLEHRLNLDASVERQHRHADGRARMASRSAEHGDHQVGCTVHHRGQGGEFGNSVDEAAKTQHAADAAEIADFALHLRQDIEAGQMCGNLGVIRSDRMADFANMLFVQLAVEIEGKLA